MASKVLRKKYERALVPTHSPNKLVSAFSQAHTCSHFRVSSCPSPTYFPPAPQNLRSLKIAQCRINMQWSTGVLAGISLALSVGGYWAVGCKLPSVTAVLCVCSLVQVWLVLFYWAQEGKTALLTSKAVGAVSKEKSKRILCGLECLLHLLIPLPRDFLVAGVQVNYVAYLLVLSRNYHFLRVLYWISPFSSLRAHLYSSFLNVGCLAYRHYLRSWSAVGTGIALLSLWLLLAATLGQEAANTGLKALARLGEGQSLAFKPAEQVAVVVSACIGVYLLALVLSAVRKAMTLTEKEAQLTAQLCAQQTSLELRTKAAELLQAWWQLLHMRHRHHINLCTVFTWYRNLLTFLRAAPHPNTRNGYCVCSHFAAIEKTIKNKIKRMRVPSRINTRLDAILRKEKSLLKRTKYLADQRKRIYMPRRLNTIREAANESTPSVKSPDTNCYFPLPLHLIGS